MTVDDALPNVRGRLAEKARLVASLRDELADVEREIRQGKGNGNTRRHATRLRRRIASNTSRAVINLRDDLAAIGRDDLTEALTEYVRRSLERRDAYRQINRLFEAERKG